MLITTEPTPLPYEPEDLISARRRYPKALKILFNIGRIKYSDAPRPGQDRTHVFDFQSGLRLIISLDHAPLNAEGERGPYEHVSASFNFSQLKLKSHETMAGVVRKTFSYISKRSPRECPFWSDIEESGVLHMLFTSEFTLKDFDDAGQYIEKTAPESP